MMMGTMTYRPFASRSFTITLASASGIIAPAYQGISAMVAGTLLASVTSRTTSGPHSHKLNAPHTDSIAVPRTARPKILFFSDFTRLWMSLGNITVAIGRTSHSNARDNVPATT